MKELLPYLVVEQFATVGLKYSTFAYVMAHGMVMYEGPSAKADDAVHSAYLGATA